MSTQTEAAKWPKINDLKLAKCCKKSLKDIDRIIKMGALLGGLTATSPFVALLDPDLASKGVTIATTDWTTLVTKTKGVETIIRNRWYTKVTWEQSKHISGPLMKFWSTMGKVALGQ